MPAEALGANDTMVADSLVPLYNASGASGRHLVNIARGPNRCDNGGASRPVTVFPGDTAHATFAIRCVERLHVATGAAGPGSDRDGFMVVVANADGSADSLPIGTVDTIGIAGVAPGEHVITLAGVDDNCIAPAPVRRMVSGRDSTLVTFIVNCPGPAAPAGLRTTLVESARIDLAWNPAPTGSPAAFHRLYRTTVGVAGSEVVVDAIAALSYSDQGLPGFTRFSYQVAGVDDDGLVGPRSAPLVVRTRDGTPPTAPAPVVASPASATAIRLVWGAAADPETGIARYRIYRAGVLVDSTSATSWRDGGLTPNTAYSYEVLAVNGEGLAGPLSQLAKATTLDGTPPSAPIGLVAMPAGATRIDLAWTAASDPESGIAGYRVYRDGALVGTTAAAIFDDSGLMPSTLYTYTVSAVNGSGLEGPPSAPAAATTAAAPVITGNLTVTIQTSGSNVPSAPFQVEVTAGSGSLVQPAAPNGAVLFSGLTAQSWGVVLQALPAHCAVVDGVNPRSVIVPAGGTASTTFLVRCR
jgi:chitodextrinase